MHARSKKAKMQGVQKGNSASRLEVYLPYRKEGSKNKFRRGEKNFGPLT